MVLPPSKRRKAPKMAWTRCPSHFLIPPSATSCTHRLTCRFGRCFCTLCRGLHRRPAPFAREAKRVNLFLDEIKKKYRGQNILLVTHGGVARAIHFYFNELPEDGQVEKYLPDNCEIREYSFN